MHIRTSLLSLGETPKAMTEGHLSHLQLDLNPPSLCSRTSALPLTRPFRLPRSEKNSNRLDGPGYRVISLSANAPFILAFGGLFLGLFAACAISRALFLPLPRSFY